MLCCHQSVLLFKKSLLILHELCPKSDSNVSRRNVTSEYKLRRQQCEEATRRLIACDDTKQMRSLRDCSLEHLEKFKHVLVLDSSEQQQLPIPLIENRDRVTVARTMPKVRPSFAEEMDDEECDEYEQDDGECEDEEPEEDDVLYRRALHIITETQRTMQAASALATQDFPRFGQLMVQSHISLKNDMEVSCPQVDALVMSALRQNGCYGCRMTGGGFGGCVVALVQREHLSTFADNVTRDFSAAGGNCSVIISDACGGCQVHH